ncbi:MAG: FAD-binding protein [Rhizobiaceae bacterium]
MSKADRLQPANEAEAADRIRAAAADGMTFAIEGGGTKTTIGRPVFADKVLSSAKLRGITAYNPAELVLTALAGTPLKHIEDELAKNNQRLAFEPADHRPLLCSDGDPTIGAVAAINNSGPRRIVAGAARDSLLGVRFVNGRGETIKNGGRVMKNVTGLDLVKLMAGSWGTLGFLTEVTFKVLPAPEIETTLLLRGLDDAGATTAMAHAMASSTEVTGAAHLPELAAGRLTGGGAATALRLEGFADSVADRMARLRGLFDGVADLAELENDESRALWRDIRDARALVGDGRSPVWRVSMTPSRGHEFVMAVRMKTAADAFYDWQGGLVWIGLEGGDPQDDLIRTELARHGGGHAMLVRADSEVRVLAPVFQPQAQPLEALSGRIKAAFDPRGLFNPGRMAA